MNKKFKQSFFIQYIKDEGIISNLGMSFDAYYNVIAESLCKKGEIKNRKLINIPIEIEFRDISNNRIKTFKKAVVTLNYVSFHISKNRVMTPAYEIKLTVECFSSTKIYYLGRQILNSIVSYYSKFNRGRIDF